MNLEGKLLGNRYEMIEKIGNGGMATVYRATDKILKRDVAVKILRDEFTTDEEFIKRFEVEAQSAARLTPVSYTHLDVYKRQLISLLLQKFLVIMKLLLTSHCLVITLKLNFFHILLCKNYLAFLIFYKILIFLNGLCSY